jgi:serine/threonine-protein kinase
MSGAVAFSSTAALPLGPVALTGTALAGTGLNPLKCVVPKLKGKALKKAKRALNAAHCRPGKVTRKHSSSVRKGHVISTSPGKGKVLPAGSKVKLTVSSG